jgi:hypothetical protein
MPLRDDHTQTLAAEQPDQGIPETPARERRRESVRSRDASPTIRRKK